MALLTPCSVVVKNDLSSTYEIHDSVSPHDKLDKNTQNPYYTYGFQTYLSSIFMKTKNFLNQHPVFTSKEYAQFLSEKGHVGARTQESLLSYHLKAGNLVRIKRGLFAVTSSQTTPAVFNEVDPYLLASKLTDDAVVAYHSALAFYGKAHSIMHQFCVLTHQRAKEFLFQGNNFCLVLFPKTLRDKNKELWGVKDVLHRGHKIKVTSFERTLVDMLDRPNLSGGWEEIWRSLESVEYFDIEKVVEYALYVGSATTMAMVGFYLEQHRDELNVKEVYLKKLEAKKPKQAHYIDRQHKLSNKFNARWNLIIPLEIIDRTWEEHNEF
jgi:predicted transcriptional regulator of viral defense system